MRNTVVNKITAAAKKDKKIFLISGDAGFGVLDEFKRLFPRRFLNLGVAEQNAISFASGMALTGFKVFVYNIAPFAMFRCYEQVRNDICYQELPVTLIGIGSGFTYAPQGVTHYSVEDIAVARSLPNLAILSPADPAEAGLCAEYALKSKTPVYIRVAKTNEPAIHKKRISSINKPIVVSKGKKVAILFHGSVSIEVIKALEGEGIKPLVVSLPMLRPLDFTALHSRLKGIKTIVTVEEHFIEGGLGSIIAEWIVKENLPFRLKKLGVKNEFIHAIKDNAGMRQKYGISSSAIRATVKKEYGRA